MNSLMIASHVGLWIVVASLSVLMFALVRQVGLLHRRIGPSVARTGNDGPAIGDAAPVLNAADLDGGAVSLAMTRGKLTMLVFVSPSCPVCSELLPAVRSIWRRERTTIEVILLSLEADESANRDYIRSHKLEGMPYVIATNQVRQYGVLTPPHAVIVGADGLVKSKGLVNHLEHLESLLTAARLGMPTLDSYMHSKKSARAEGLPGPAPRPQEASTVDVRA